MMKPYSSPSHFVYLNFIFDAVLKNEENSEKTHLYLLPLPLVKVLNTGEEESTDSYIPKTALYIDKEDFDRVKDFKEMFKEEIEAVSYAPYKFVDFFAEENNYKVESKNLLGLIISNDGNTALRSIEKVIVSYRVIKDKELIELGNLFSNRKQDNFSLIYGDRVYVLGQTAKYLNYIVENNINLLYVKDTVDNSILRYVDINLKKNVGFYANKTPIVEKKLKLNEKMFELAQKYLTDPSKREINLEMIKQIREMLKR